MENYGKKKAAKSERKVLIMNKKSHKSLYYNDLRLL